MANLKYLRPSIPQNSPKLSLPFPSLTLLTALQNCGYWSMIAIAQAILYYNSIVFYAINSQYGHLKLNIFFLSPCHSQRGSRINLFSFLYGWRQCQWPLVLTHVHLTHESMPVSSKCFLTIHMRLELKWQTNILCPSFFLFLQWCWGSHPYLCLSWVSIQATELDPHPKLIF